MLENSLEYTCYVHATLSVLFIIVYLWRRQNGTVWTNGTLPTIGFTHAICALLFQSWFYLVCIAQQWPMFNLLQSIVLAIFCIVGATGGIITGVVLCAYIGAKQYNHLPIPVIRKLIQIVLIVAVVLMAMRSCFNTANTADFLAMILCALLCVYAATLYVTATAKC